MNPNALLAGVAFALAFRAIVWLFRRAAPSHAVAALDSAGPADWAACGLFALFFAFLVAI